VFFLKKNEWTQIVDAPGEKNVEKLLESARMILDDGIELFHSENKVKKTSKKRKKNDDDEKPTKRRKRLSMEEKKERIIDALKKGEMRIKDLSKETDMSQTTISMTLKEMENVRKEKHQGNSLLISLMNDGSSPYKYSKDDLWDLCHLQPQGWKEKIGNLWGSGLKYKGDDLFDIYNSTLPEKMNSGQECYLHYDISKDELISGWQTDEGEKLFDFYIENGKGYLDDYCRVENIYGPNGYCSKMEMNPNIVFIRLD
jgi:DNA-binding transcriptional ArsR family regulator